MPVGHLPPLDEELPDCIFRDPGPSPLLLLDLSLPGLLFLLFLVLHPLPSPGEDLLHLAGKGVAGAPGAGPLVVRILVQRRLDTPQMVRIGTRVAAKKLSTLLALPEI